MTILYKLTDENGCTRNNTQWGPGVMHFAEGSADQPLCSDGWIHAYEHPLLAVLLNPIHGDFENPRLWEAEGVVGKRDGQLKCGCRVLTTLREIPLPTVTLAQRVRFAILCAQQVCNDEKWNHWADAWLDGSDRTARTVDAAVWVSAYAAAEEINLVALAEQAIKEEKQ